MRTNDQISDSARQEPPDTPHEQLSHSTKVYLCRADALRAARDLRDRTLLLICELEAGSHPDTRSDARDLGAALSKLLLSLGELQQLRRTPAPVGI